MSDNPIMHVEQIKALQETIANLRRQLDAESERVRILTVAIENLRIRGGCFCGMAIPDDLHAAYCVKANAAVTIDKVSAATTKAL